MVGQALHGHARDVCRAIAGAGLRALLPVCAWAALQGLSPSPAAAASLDQELAGLIDTHPQLRATRHAIEGAEHGITKAFSGFLPRIGVTGDVGYERTDSPARRDSAGQAFRSGRQKATLNVTENIFDGFRSTNETLSARAQRQLARIDYQTLRQDLMFEGISAYLDVLRQTQLVELAIANEQTLQTQLDLEDARVERGSGIAADVLLAKSRLQVARERRVAFTGLLNDATSRYRQVFGRPPEVGDMIDPVAPEDLLPEDVDQGIALAVQENPAVGISRELIRVARQRREIARSDYFPRVDLFGRNNWERNVDGTSGVRRDWSVGVRLNWELYSGQGTRSSVAQAASEYSASLSNSRQVDRKVEEEVRLAWQAMETNRERVDLLENAVNIALEVFDARQKLRTAGRGTLVNVLDAENEVYDAQINLTNADAEFKASVYRVLRAMGRLTPQILQLTVDDEAMLDGPRPNSPALERLERWTVGGE